MSMPVPAHSAHFLQSTEPPHPLSYPAPGAQALMAIILILQHQESQGAMTGISRDIPVTQNQPGRASLPWGWGVGLREVYVNRSSQS